jgi:uncharacterized protein YfaS (alpha-2-macroglobulin family)
MPHQGETGRVVASITDFDGEPLTPASQEVKFYDPTGALKGTETSPTKKADGLYYVRYTFPIDSILGKWVVKWKFITVDAETKTGKLSISVTSAP